MENTQFDGVPPDVVGRARLLREAEVPPQLIVKFREDASLSEDASLEFVAAQTNTVFQAVAGSAQLGPPMRAAFTLPATKVAHIMSTARAADPARELPDLQKFFARQTPSLRHISLPEAVSATQQLLSVVSAIRASPLVEAAYIESPAACPPTTVRFFDDTYVADQAYLKGSPEGVGSIPLWRMGHEGSAGDGMRFVDVESGWYTDHEDLALADTTPVVGFSKNDKEHGTSVLGIINAVDNDKGVIGIAPRARGYIASKYIMFGGKEYECPAAAMIFALFHLMGDEQGHVMVVEMQCTVVEKTGSGGSTDVLLPVEAELFNWAVIIVAVACGVAVVEAAGNGDRRINTARVADLPAGTFDFLSEDHDSGAIIVGAGEYTGAGGTPYIRHADSNYGSRVDCFARGDDMYSCGHSPSTYTTINLTSSATAIVAGVALVTQSFAREVLGSTFGPRLLRRIVCGTAGTASIPYSGIRAMPDLVRIGEAIKVLAAP